nr:unnamed protein product [Meloidogyne enterolobii]
MAESIPLFFHGVEHIQDDMESIAFLMEMPDSDESSGLRFGQLILPIIPKTIEEMIFVRYCLEQLFNWFFHCAEFDNIIFNPKMINLLFDNDKTIPRQFHVQELTLVAGNDMKVSLRDTGLPINENIFEFALNHFVIYDNLGFSLNQNNIGKYIDVLFNIIINEGSKLPEICFNIKSSILYYRIIEYITTSKDVSKMVPTITLNCGLIVPLNERAENVENTQEYGSKVIKYQFSNIYCPKVKFSFWHQNMKFFNGEDLIEIKKMEEKN